MSVGLNRVKLPGMFTLSKVSLNPVRNGPLFLGIDKGSLPRKLNKCYANSWPLGLKFNRVMEFEERERERVCLPMLTDRKHPA